MESLLDYCLEIDVDVNSSNIAGDTPLICACKAGDHSAVSKLIDAGANVNHANFHGNTALHYACFWRYNDIALLLVKICNAFVKVSNNFKRLPTDHTSTILKDVLQEYAAAQGDQILHGKSLTDLVSSTEALNLDWNVDPTDIQIEDPIFEGRHSSIYRGYWNDKLCAIKVPNIDRDVTDQELQAMKHELALIRKMNHTNLAPILCASIAPGWSSGFVMNFEENGSLDAILMDSSMEMTPQEAIQYAIEITKGLLHLHEFKPHAIHGNLKLSNILIQHDGTLALSDFGFRKSLLSSRVNEPLIIHEPEWLAPEILVGSPVEDERHCDIYSFGLVLFSIITRQPLFAISNPMIIGYKIALEKLKPQIPTFIPAPLTSLLQQTWQPQPNSRPNIRMIYNQLLQYKF